MNEISRRQIIEGLRVVAKSLNKDMIERFEKGHPFHVRVTRGSDQIPLVEIWWEDIKDHKLELQHLFRSEP